MTRRWGYMSALALVFFAVSASGQATRTWVSGVGDDVNPCSRTAPCKTYAGAISKTASGGTISTLDPGGYGAITITKPITIEGTGTLASILNSGTNGIVVNITTGVNRNVVIRDVSIIAPNPGSPSASGLNGVRVLAADNVTIERVNISGQSGVGIEVSPTTTTSVNVLDSSIYNVATGGILSKAVVVNATTRLTVRNTSIRNTGQYGVSTEAIAGTTSFATISDSSIANTTNHGVHANGTGGGVSTIAVFNSTLASIKNFSAPAGNGNALTANGGTASVFVTDSVISNCSKAFNAAGGVINSFGDNRDIASEIFSNPSGAVLPKK